MNPTQGNPGLSPEILEAINRRSQGQPSSQLNQVSPGAPNANVPQPTPQSGLTAASSPQSAPPQKFVPQDRKDIIVQALIEQLDIDNKADKQALSMSQPMGGGMGGCGYERK